MRCDLCKDESMVRLVIDEVSMMAYGHVYHSSCFIKLFASSPIQYSIDPHYFLCHEQNSYLIVIGFFF